MTITADGALALFLRRLLLRSALTTEEQAAILALEAIAAPAPARRDIIAIGQEVSFACLVGEGMTARFDQLANGSRQTVALHIAGDMCDLPSVVMPVAGWGITALTDAIVFRIPHDALRGVAERYPAIAMAFWRDSVADAATLAKWVTNIGRKDARARLAHLFCEMGRRIELSGLGERTCYLLPLSQEQIADAVGLTGVHVNRVLRAMREAGLMTYRNQTVEVADPRRLAAIAEFDPAFLLLPAPGQTRER